MSVQGEERSSVRARPLNDLVDAVTIYPRGMSGKTREPDQSSPPEARGEDSGRTPVERDADGRFGPLAVQRHRKDDGRALLLYEMRGDGR